MGSQGVCGRGAAAIAELEVRDDHEQELVSRQGSPWEVRGGVNGQ
jgi:hypothetical protein